MKGIVSHATIDESRAGPSGDSAAALRRLVDDYRSVVLDPPTAASPARSSADASGIKDHVIAWGKRARSTGQLLTREAAIIGAGIVDGLGTEGSLVGDEDRALAKVRSAERGLVKEEVVLARHREDLQNAQGEEDTSGLSYRAAHSRHLIAAGVLIGVVALMVHFLVDDVDGIVSTLVLAACTALTVSQLEAPIRRYIGRVLRFIERVVTMAT